MMSLMENLFFGFLFQILIHEDINTSLKDIFDEKLLFKSLKIYENENNLI